jgi:hypothetical protein
MNDERLRELLRELPREQARHGFAARVLARLDGEPATVCPAWLRPTAVAAAAAVLALVAIPLRIHYSRPSEPNRAEAVRMLRELRAEHRRLEQELEAISPPAPVLYLGGDENVELVIDVSRVPQAQPAAFRPDSF